ncbi:Uncharacterised protein [Streptococcus pneumoniae]|nr:Uncharacterised protein [Streptococcus pneumoniae]
MLEHVLDGSSLLQENQPYLISSVEALFRYDSITRHLSLAVLPIFLGKFL